MDDWEKFVRALDGKHVGTSVYLHKSALPLRAAKTAALAASIAGVTEAGYDLVKFSRLSPQVSLLSYPGFFEQAFPVLDYAWTVDLTTNRSSERNYSKYANRPILHRKELFLALDDPRRKKFAAITGKLEALGMFYDMNKMGSEKPWFERLRKAGITVSGNVVRT